MPAEIFSIGVDLGGTWIRLEALDAHQREVRSFKAHAPSVAQLPSFLKKRLRLWKAKPPHLIVASRGVWSRPERTRLARALRSLAHRITVMSDVEAAWHAAFRDTGVIVIAGTGSIAFGRNAAGRSARAGGLGPFVGDEGSAFWIGKEWLKRSQGRQVKGSHLVVRRVASLTPRILNQAHRGNALAKGLVIEAQNHLADLAVSVANRLHFGKTVPVSWGGSVLKNPDFRSGFLTALRKAGTLSRKNFRVIAPRLRPVIAIAKLSS